MAHEDLTADQRVLAEHRWAVRCNLPDDAAHAARTARWTVDNATYARVPVPADVVEAVELLEWFAGEVARQVEQERAQRVLSGMDEARFQRELERAALRRLHDAAGPDQGQVPDDDDDDRPTEG
jgi:hypothetical protein